jgi:hypothetical protein
MSRSSGLWRRVVLLNYHRREILKTLIMTRYDTKMLQHNKHLKNGQNMVQDAGTVFLWNVESCMKLEGIRYKEIVTTVGVFLQWRNDCRQKGMLH